MSTHQKIQQALEKIDLAANFAKNNRSSKVKNFFIKYGFELTWSGFVLLPLWFVLIGSALQNDSWGVILSLIPAMGIFATGLILTDSARQEMNANGLTMSHLKINVALGLPSAEFKLNVLKLAQNTQLKTQLLEQLVAASERDDVPQGWWDVVNNALQEEWDAQKHNHEMKMKAQYQKKMEQELKNFGAPDVIHIQQIYHQTHQFVRSLKCQKKYKQYWMRWMVRVHWRATNHSCAKPNLLTRLLAR